MLVCLDRIRKIWVRPYNVPLQVWLILYLINLISFTWWRRLTSRTLKIPYNIRVQEGYNCSTRPYKSTWCTTAVFIQRLWKCFVCWKFEWTDGKEASWKPLKGFCLQPLAVCSGSLHTQNGMVVTRDNCIDQIHLQRDVAVSRARQQAKIRAKLCTVRAREV